MCGKPGVNRGSLGIPRLSVSALRAILLSLSLLIHGLGSVGIFASRAFLPAFATALVLRFGPHVPWVADAGLLEHVRGVPTWFTSDTALVVLGVLSALELLAERVSEVRMVLDEVHDYLKVGMAALTFLGVLSATDLAVARGVLGEAGPLDYLSALAVGAGTFLGAKARGAVVGPLSEADEDDDLGLQGLFRWVEDLWAGLGPLALILLPLATITLLGLAVVLLVFIERRIEAVGEAARVPCANCGEPIHAAATACPFCKAPNKEPRAVGVLGRTLSRPADPSRHSYRLVSVKRCPVCASRFERRAVRQSCDTCGFPLMEDERFARSYIGSIDRRVPFVCVACFLLGLVPVLGVIPGVIVYRLMIVAPFRRYIPPGHGFVLRWGVRLLILALVAFQWVPVAGGFAVPAMALVNYGAYRSVYRRLALTA